MTLRNIISAVTLSIISSWFLINWAFANSYTSEIFNSIWECNTQKEKNDKLYTNFYRSECSESKDWDFYYNICDTNYCVTSDDTSKFLENKEKEIYQYDSSNYQLDDITNEKLKKLAEGLEVRFQKMSESDLEKWNENFSNVLESLAEKSKNNDKNLALIDGIKSQIGKVLTKQKAENDLCKNQYWIGWKEASFFFESDNMITWIEWNKKHTLACEYKEPVKKIETDYLVEKKEIVNNPEKEKIIDPNIDITAVVQWIYRSTKNKYLDTQTSRYTRVDICEAEYWVAWQESKEKNADAYIMLYNKYWIETSGYTQYWNWEKLVTTPKDKLLHKACVKNTLDTVVNENYRITQWKYRWNSLRDWDVCKWEYWDGWKVSKNPTAYTDTFAYHSKKYPSLAAWSLYNDTAYNDCWGFHWNDSWNGTVHTKSGNKKVNSCSYNIDKKQDSKANHNHFVCEKESIEKKDITAVVQGLYKTTQNKYSYNEAYWKDFDYCKVEYGRSWKRNIGSVDANIMLYSKYWVNTWIEWGKVWNGSDSKTSWVNKNHIACIEDIYHYKNENYKELLTPVTVDKIHSLMNTLENEIKSKIKETDSHIYFNNKYAITKKKYYWNQIYSQRKCAAGVEHGCFAWQAVSWVCPLGYDLDDFTLYQNNYEKELIWYYLEHNRDKFHLTHDKAQASIWLPMWRWWKFDEYYVRKVSLERIKKESQTNTFSTHNFRFTNPGIAWRQVEKYNKYHYSSDMWSSEKVGTLLPALCVSKTAIINDVNNKNRIVTDFKSLETITENIKVNNWEIEVDKWLFYAYGKSIARWFFEKSSKHKVIGQEFFLPIRASVWWNWLMFIKKHIK